MKRPVALHYIRTMTSEQHLDSSSSSEATALIARLLPQNALSMMVLHRTSNCCWTSPCTLSSNGLPSLPKATPYKSSVWARWTILFICLQDSATAFSTGSKSRNSGSFQHSISRYLWNVFRFFFLGSGAAVIRSPENSRLPLLADMPLFSTKHGCFEDILCRLEAGLGCAIWKAVAVFVVVKTTVAKKTNANFMSIISLSVTKILLPRWWNNVVGSMYFERTRNGRSRKRTSLPGGWIMSCNSLYSLFFAIPYLLWPMWLVCDVRCVMGFEFDGRRW